MKIRINVTFYEVFNGFAKVVGIGKEITLANGNCYAIIDGKLFLVISWDNESRLILNSRYVMLSKVMML